MRSLILYCLRREEYAAGQYLMLIRLWKKFYTGFPRIAVGTIQTAFLTIFCIVPNTIQIVTCEIFYILKIEIVNR